MRGDKIVISHESAAGADRIMELIQSSGRTFPLAVAIAGESGAGKSSTALSLAHLTAEAGRKSITLAQDDYFHLPPADNHEQRMKDLTRVGPGEVDLELLNEHVCRLKDGLQVDLRIVSWDENSVGWEPIDAQPWDMVIVEGTYVSLLAAVDVRAFVDRTYHDTRADRISRARERVTPFIEEVLEIEHRIIAKHRVLADVVI